MSIRGLFTGGAVPTFSIDGAPDAVADDGKYLVYDPTVGRLTYDYPSKPVDGGLAGPVIPSGGGTAIFADITYRAYSTQISSTHRLVTLTCDGTSTTGPGPIAGAVNYLQFTVDPKFAVGSTQPCGVAGIMLNDGAEYRPLQARVIGNIITLSSPGVRTLTAGKCTISSFVITYVAGAALTASGLEFAEDPPSS
jgi:hypothetical protein